MHHVQSHAKGRALAEAMIDGKAFAHVEAKTAEEKAARLKALRLAKEAADQGVSAEPMSRTNGSRVRHHDGNTAKGEMKR